MDNQSQSQSQSTQNMPFFGLDEPLPLELSNPNTSPLSATPMPITVESLFPSSSTLFDFPPSLSPMQQAYIIALSSCGTPTRACRKLNLSLKIINLWARENQDFKNHLEEAQQIIADSIEDEAFRRAMGEGGSDKLLQVILKASKPQKYSEKYESHQYIHSMADLAKAMSLDAIDVTPTPQIEGEKND